MLAAVSMCVILDRQKTGVEEEVELIEAEVEIGDQVFGPVSACRRLDACSFGLNLCC
jgi:hypothetical protein